MRLAAGHPLVLVLDDLHWADGASLELVSYLLGHPPRAAVMVARAFRTGQADRRSSPPREGGGGGGPLTRSPRPAHPADARRPDRRRRRGGAPPLYETSGGNPFYLLQLALMAEGGGAQRAPGSRACPEAIAAAIVGELDALSGPARRLAETSAVVGDPFDLDVAIETARDGGGGCAVALDELTGHDLVRSRGGAAPISLPPPLGAARRLPACLPGVRLAAHRQCADALAAAARRPPRGRTTSSMPPATATCAG